MKTIKDQIKTAMRRNGLTMRALSQIAHKHYGLAESTAYRYMTKNVNISVRSAEILLKCANCFDLDDI